MIFLLGEKKNSSYSVGYSTEFSGLHSIGASLAF